MSVKTLMVEHLKVLISRAPKGPYGRAPKGDGGQSSLLAHSIYLLGGGVSMAALTVEHLKVMAALTVEHANASSPLLISRAP